MEIPEEIAQFEDRKMKNVSPWRWDGGESPPRKRFGDGTKFHPSSRGDSIPKNFIKLTFINVYLSNL
jgi:hypothetical protein